MAINHAAKRTKLKIMTKTFIHTRIGLIAVHLKLAETGKIPVLFLHGVYFDHRLWEYQIEQIHDRTVIALDMPLHGESRSSIKNNWDLNDCADMLLEVLDHLNIEKVIAVGHSWGSMTIVRACHKQPERFAALGLCNMPFKALSKMEMLSIRLQHTAMLFRNFYIKQAGNALMGKESLEQNPQLMQKLLTAMEKLSNKEIRYTDKAVRIEAKDATPILQSLGVPAIALTGEEDYVGVPPVAQTIMVKGGHVSPLEAPKEVNNMIGTLTGWADGLLHH